jgi:hypothetical protein
LDLPFEGRPGSTTQLLMWRVSRSVIRL